jgi:hypothetical protein
MRRSFRRFFVSSSRSSCWSSQQRGPVAGSTNVTYSAAAGTFDTKEVRYSRTTKPRPKPRPMYANSAPFGLFVFMTYSFENVNFSNVEGDAN